MHTSIHALCTFFGGIRCVAAVGLVIGALAVAFKLRPVTDMWVRLLTNKISH